MADVKDNELDIGVANPYFEKVMIPKGFRVATYEMISDANANRLAVMLPFGSTEHLINVGDHMTEAQQTQLVSLLLKHSKAFPLNGEIGETNLASHQISNYLCIHGRPYSLLHQPCEPTKTIDIHRSSVLDLQ